MKCKKCKDMGYFNGKQTWDTKSFCTCEKGKFLFQKHLELTELISDEPSARDLHNSINFVIKNFA